ncbi:WD40 repeat domain-containing protein [Blastopirellula marina]|uniref:WD40 repeat domain-containing protein n=1 Tax=Blastopirellula marina TaxID=124 RepID=UPI001304CD30|nr:hypothetical protein [Blastopirellula marina]
MAKVPPIPVWCIDFSPDGTMLASAAGNRPEKGLLTIWDTTSWDVLCRLPQPNALTCVAFSPDSQTLAAGTQKGEILVFDTTSRTIINRWPSGQPAVFGINWTPNGQLIVGACADGILITLVPDTGEVRQTFDAWKADGLPKPGADNNAPRNQWDATVSPDGKTLLSAGWNDTTRLWDLETGKLMASFPAEDERTQGVKFTPDQRHFASSGLGVGCVRIREMETHRERITLPIVGRDVAIHPGGGLIAASSMSEVKVFAVNLDKPTPKDEARVKDLLNKTGQKDAKLRNSAMEALRQIGPRIEPLLYRWQLEHPSQSYSTQLDKLWQDLRTPTLVAEFNTFQGEIRQVTISPKGNLMAASTTEGEVRVWNIPEFTSNCRLEVAFP